MGSIPISGTDNKLKLPTLEITYAERYVDQISFTDSSLVSSPSITFQTQYSQSNDTAATGLTSAFIVFAVLAAVYGIHACNQFNKTNYQPTDAVTLSMLIEWTMIFADVASMFLFSFMFFVCLYYFFTFKVQTSSIIALPTSTSILSAFNTILVIATISSVIRYSLNLQVTLFRLSAVLSKYGVKQKISYF